jgi:flagellar basal-body rod protein FlgB
VKTLLDGIFKDSLPGLEKALDLSFRRNQAIGSNIANAETPGYRAADLSFGNELKKAFGQSAQPLKMTNSKHIDLSTNSGAHLVADLSGATKPDGNNVDLDIQMGQLAFNRGRYSQAASMVRKKFSMLANAIRTVA